MSTKRHIQTKRSMNWKTLSGKPKATPRIKDRKLIVPYEPPSVNPSPWVPATIARLMTWGAPPITTGLVQSTDIIDWLMDQIDPDRKYLPRNDKYADTTKPIYYRLESVMVWNLTGRTVALNVQDLQTGDVSGTTVNDEDYESLGSWFDSCSGNTPPRVGFRWPTSNRQKILSNHRNPATGYGEGLRHICNILAPRDDQIMVHFRLFWRFPATGKEMLSSIIGMMDVHSAIKRVETAVQSRASLGLQQQIFDALPNKFLGAVPVWVENKILPTDENPSDKTGIPSLPLETNEDDKDDINSSMSVLSIEDICNRLCVLEQKIK